MTRDVDGGPVDQPETYHTGKPKEPDSRSNVDVGGLHPAPAEVPQVLSLSESIEEYRRRRAARHVKAHLVASPPREGDPQ